MSLDSRPNYVLKSPEIVRTLDNQTGHVQIFVLL
jgi:hypothetical protein